MMEHGQVDSRCAPASDAGMTSYPVVFKACNVLAFVAGLLVQSFASGSIGKNSSAYDTVANPAGPAFAIWGLIFVWVAVFVVAQCFDSNGFLSLLPQLTPWFCLSQFGQGIWVPIFTRSDPAFASSGGDIWFWTSALLLVALLVPFLKLTYLLSNFSSARPYWLSLGVCINAAWIIIAAGLDINMMGRVLGLSGALLSLVAASVLGATIWLELALVGIFCNLGRCFQDDKGGRAANVFLPVATWALIWVFVDLSDTSRNSERVNAIEELYGQGFTRLYKWTVLIAAVGFTLLWLGTCLKRSSEEEDASSGVSLLSQDLTSSKPSV